MNDPKIPRSVNKYIITSTSHSVTITFYYRPYLEGVELNEEPIELSSFVLDKTLMPMFLATLVQHYKGEAEPPHSRL